MSATTQTIITCDWAGKNCQGNDWSADMSYKSARYQRIVAISFGWVNVGRKDYCPVCWIEKNEVKK